MMMRKAGIIFLTGAWLLLSMPAGAQVNIAHFMQGGRYELSQGNYAASIKKFNIVITYKPELFEPYFLRGIAKLYLGDYQGAELDLGMAAGIHPLYSHAYHYRAITRAQMYNYASALEDFGKALSIDPFNPDIYLDRGLTLINMRNYNRAIEDLNQAIKYNRNIPRAYLYRAIARSSLKENEAAIEDCNKALMLDYFNTDTYLKRGQIYYQMEAYEQALADFEQLLNLDPGNSLAIFHRGLTRISTGDTSGAIRDFDRVVNENPYNALTYYNRAWLKAGIKDYQGSLKDYDMVIGINPNNIYAWYGRAYIYQQLGQYEEALSDYSKCIELFPDFAGAYLQRSYSRQMTGDQDGARRDHDKAFAIINLLNDGDTSTEALMKVYADSNYFRKLIALESDFNVGNMAGEINRAYEGIALQPNFTVQYVKMDHDFIRMKRNRQSISKLPGLYVGEDDDYGFAVMSAVPGKRPGTPGEGAGTADSLTRNSPANHLGHFLEGVINGMAGNYNTSLDAYGKAISLSPRFAYAYFNRANVRYELEEYKYNESIYADKVTITWEKASGPKEQAVVREPDFNTVMQDYNSVIELMPSFSYAYFNRANIRCRLRDYNSAIIDYTQALHLEPAMAEAWFNRGLTYIYLGQPEQGCIDLGKAGELGIDDAYGVIRRFCYK
jgi:tetratricopeptide (TPR) repeat protein